MVLLQYIPALAYKSCKGVYPHIYMRRSRLVEVILLQEIKSLGSKGILYLANHNFTRSYRTRRTYQPNLKFIFFSETNA